MVCYDSSTAPPLYRRLLSLIFAAVATDSTIRNHIIFLISHCIESVHLPLLGTLSVQ